MGILPTPHQRTKIVCTIGPASQTADVMVRLIEAGLNIARLNFSHGDASVHRSAVRTLREAERRTGRPVTILGDLPGPKIRIGRLAAEPVELRTGEPFVLTANDVIGDAARASVMFPRLPAVVSRGTRLSLNDGLIELAVERVDGSDIHCRILAGGELRSRKGVNVPGVDLGIGAFTEDDRRWLAFALAEGVDAVSQSFVESAADLVAVREAAAALGGRPFLIAKIERARALGNLPSILDACDGVMIARGDLGVEIPIERIAPTQKRIMIEAIRRGRPVITATQMLESMTAHPLPTRAEATDVANAVIDGTDAVMLSGESAMGKYPVEAVQMLGRIAGAAEAEPPATAIRTAVRAGEGLCAPERAISLGLEAMVDALRPSLLLVPTVSGATARAIARFRFPLWTVAVTPEEQTFRALQFSSGVLPVLEPSPPADWRAFIRERLADLMPGRGTALLIEGPSASRPGANHRIELIDIPA